MQKILGLAAVFATVTVGLAWADTTFTAAEGLNCKDASKPEFGLWVCPGPGGYAALFADEGNMVSVTFAPAVWITKAEPTAQWRGAGKAFGDKIQWIIRGGIPRAAVIRTWRRPDNDEREIQELSIFVIDGRRACGYGAVDVHQAKVTIWRWLKPKKRRARDV